jgi:hypothetical protein
MATSAREIAQTLLSRPTGAGLEQALAALAADPNLTADLAATIAAATRSTNRPLTPESQPGSVAEAFRRVGLP